MRNLTRKTRALAILASLLLCVIWAARIWRLCAFHPRFTIPGTSGQYTTRLRGFSPDSRLLLLYDDPTDTIQMWNVWENRQELAIAAESLDLSIKRIGHGPVWKRPDASHFSPDNRYFVLGKDDGLNLHDLSESPPSTPHKFKIDRHKFSPDGRILAGWSYPERYLNLFDLSTGKELATIPAVPLFGYPVESGFLFAPKGDLVAFRPGKPVTRQWIVGKVCLWSVLAGKVVATLDGDLQFMGFSPTGDRIALHDADKIRLYHMPSGEQIATFTCSPCEVFRTLGFSLTGDRLVAGSYDIPARKGTLHLWNLRSLLEECTLDTSCTFWGPLEFAASGDSLVCKPWTRDEEGYVWKITSSPIRQVWQGSLDWDGERGRRAMVSAALGTSPNQRLAVVSDTSLADKQNQTMPAKGTLGPPFVTEPSPTVPSLRVLDMVTGQLGRRFGNGKDWMYSGDGKTVATRPYEKDIEIWDVYLPPPLLTDPQVTVIPVLVLLIVLLAFSSRKRIQQAQGPHSPETDQAATEQAMTPG
jgi:WD40 repeat protein